MLCNKGETEAGNQCAHVGQQREWSLDWGGKRVRPNHPKSSIAV